MEKDALRVYCPSCGAPAKFDIVRQVYRCGFCGGETTVEDSLKQKESMLEEHNDRLEKSSKSFGLMQTKCSGCGATVIFEEGEATSNCGFCRRSLVRNSYVHTKKLPHSVIPFAVTKKEAEQRLIEWCETNKKRPESAHLLSKIKELKGYYLPYEMATGPIGCVVNKTKQSTRYAADGFLKSEFVNCSNQLDNLLLDAMEPYDLEGLKEFDFAYVAGQGVKISDISDKEIEERLEEEVAENCRPGMVKMWGSRAIDVSANAKSTIKIPVVLPVYYINDGNVLAAVNGQTGKVSVKAEKESKYIESPWWVNGLLTLILACLATFSAICFGGCTSGEALYVTGMLAIVYAFVFFAMWDSGYDNSFIVTKYREVFTSGEAIFKREKGKLVIRDEVLKRKLDEPIFIEKIDGKEQPVKYQFRTFKRMLKMLLIALGIIFLPVVLALFINGFDFKKLSLLSSAVWFIIALPTVPIFFVQKAFQEIYDNPLIYLVDENGNTKRYRRKIKIDRDKIKNICVMVLLLLVKPPICFAVWFGIISFIVTVYLTAGF